MNEEYIILSSNKNKQMAITLSNKLNILNGDLTIKKAHGTETSVNIKSYLYQKDVFLIFDIIQPINEYIMQLMFICDAIRKKGAKNIYLITSYIPYSKIKSDTEYKLNFNLFSRMLDLLDITRIYTFGMYIPKLSYCIKTPVYNISPKVVFSKVLEDNFSEKKDLFITTIDYEMQDTIRDINKKINAEVLFPRQNVLNNKIEFEINKNVNGKDILIIADAINTGKIITKYANFLTLKGARSIYIIATHGIIDKEAIPLIENSIIKKIFVVSHHFSKSQKIKIISTIDIIKEIINRSMEKKNIKTLLK